MNILVDENNEIIKADIQKSINIFKEKLGKNSEFFSYPFGEYSIILKILLNLLDLNMLLVNIQV